MPTPIWITGFEYGLATPTTNGGGLAGIISGAPTIQSTIKRTGSYALKITPAGASTYLMRLLSSNIVVGRFYIYFSAWPDVTCNILVNTTSIGSNAKFRLDPADNKMAVNIGGANTKSTNALVLDTWYCVDYRVNETANPNTIEWQIDGVAQTTHSYAQAADTMVGTLLGDDTAQTGATFYFDDVILSLTTADYPIGAGAVIGFRPDAGGRAKTRAEPSPPP